MELSLDDLAQTIAILIFAGLCALITNLLLGD